MALKSVDLNHVSDYVLKQERDKDGNPNEGATVFKLRRLSPRVLAHVKDTSSEFRPDPDAGEGQMKASFLPNKCAIETIRCALTGWENLIGSDDNAIQFKSYKRNIAGRDMGVATADSMDCLDLEWIREMSEEVDKENTVTPEEAKTSA